MPFWPDAAWKDVVFALAVGSVVLVLSIVLGPPELGTKADPTIVEAYPRPDWYFLWYFALLALVPAAIEDAFIVGFPLLLGLMFVLLPFVAPTGERSYKRRPWAVGIVVFFTAGIAALVVAGLPGAVVARCSSRAAAAERRRSRSAPAGRRRRAAVRAARTASAATRVAGAGGQRGPDLTTVGNRLSPDQLTWRILNGGRNMPAYGSTLTPLETNALVDFLGGLR